MLIVICFYSKESEDSCRGLCQRVVDEWLRREEEKLTELREEEDKAKELAGNVYSVQFTCCN